jgi:hypothetical protein
MAGETAHQRVSADIAQSLRDVDKEHLVGLLSDLIKVYVIEGTASLSVEASPSGPVGQREAVSFARLIADLKAKFTVPELDSFRVEGEQVFVTIGAQTFRLDNATAQRRAGTTDAPRAAPAIQRDDRKNPPGSERSRLIEVD